MTFDIRKPLKVLMSGLVVATMASVSFIGPAAAAGSISLTFLPGNTQDANAMRAGLQIFSLINGLQNGANVRQYGFNNQAGIGQNGYGNNGLIYQEGNGHSANLQQNGYDNSYGIFQFGENTNANVTQNGYGQTGATFVFGF